MWFDASSNGTIVFSSDKIDGFTEKKSEEYDPSLNYSFDGENLISEKREPYINDKQNYLINEVNQI